MSDIFINGPAGRLEAKYQSHPGIKDAPVAIVLHPDPRFGGTMHNKVVYTLYQTFYRLGFNVLRFNFRGVGRSQGQFDNGEGELADAAAAMDWLEANNQTARFWWIAGFSFGAWITMQLLMRRPEVDGFVAVAPPADKYDFSFLAPCPTSGLFMVGNKDEIVAPDSIEKLAKRLMHQRSIQIEYREIDGADHFFTQKLSDLHGEIDEYVRRSLERHQWPPLVTTAA